MKKLRLAITALVASDLLATPAVAADPIRINVIGYLQTYIGRGHFDKDGASGINKYDPVSFRYEGELWFQGQTKLDNGTNIGLRIELEAWSQGGVASGSVPTSGIADTKDQMDEEYLFAFGDWGRIEFGGTNSASWKMTYTTPTALLNHSFATDHRFGQWRSNTALSANAAEHGNFSSGAGLMTSDANKLTYFTPRIYGFQLGGSYTPQFGPARPAFAVGNAAQCGFISGGANTNACANNADQWRNGVDIGVNYLNKWGDLSVALYAGHAFARKDRASSTTSTLVNFRAWALGANFVYQGFTLGGGMGKDNNGTTGNATSYYTAGLMYELGHWQASLAWWHGKRREKDPDVVGSGGALGADKVNYFQLGVNYTLGPGVKLVGGFIYDLRSGQTIAEKADAWQFLLGTELRF